MAKEKKKGAKLHEWRIPTPRAGERFDHDYVMVDVRIRYEKGKQNGEDDKSEFVVELSGQGFDREFANKSVQALRKEVTEFLSRVTEVTDIEDCLVVEARGWMVEYTRAQRGKLDGDDVHRTEQDGTVSRYSWKDRKRTTHGAEPPEVPPVYGNWQMGPLKTEHKRESYERQDRDGTFISIVPDLPQYRAAITQALAMVEHVEQEFARLFSGDKIIETLAQPQFALPAPAAAEESPPPKKRKRR